MQKVTYYCDICGKEIKDYSRKIATVIESDKTPEGAVAHADLLSTKYDFCGRCLSKIDQELVKFIKNLKHKIEADKQREAIEPQLEESEEPKADEPKKEGKRKKLDDGKIGALREAGWTLQQIAEEMGASPQTIFNHLKAMGF